MLMIFSFLTTGCPHSQKGRIVQPVGNIILFAAPLGPTTITHNAAGNFETYFKTF